MRNARGQTQAGLADTTNMLLYFWPDVILGMKFTVDASHLAQTRFVEGIQGAMFLSFILGITSVGIELQR